MRISNNMLSNTVVFNMQRSLSRFLNLQTQMSSGKRINKPSDDPIGIQRDLGYRTELTKNEQYRGNISQAQSWMNSYDAILADLNDNVSTGKEIAVSMANGNYDAVARAGAATEVESLFDRLIQLANNEQDGRYVFSGYRTNDPALIAGANGVEYNGDTGRINYQVESSSQMTVNLNAADVFLAQLAPIGENSDLDIALTGATALADLHNSAGIDQTTGTFTITDLNLGITSTVDISAAVTVDDVINAVNTQLAADGITDVVARLGDEGNNLFLDTTASGQITTNTALSRLNSGNGVDLQPGTLVVTDDLGVTVNVDLSGAASIGDVVNAFNTQMTAAGYPQVTMGLNAAGTGLQIDDASGVMGLRIAEIDPDQSTALNLGIRGAVSPTLVGSDLDPLVGFAVEETTGTTAADLGLLSEFTGDYAGEDLDPALLLTSNIADINHGLGMDPGRLVIHHGTVTRTVDLTDPAIVTVQDVIDKINGIGFNITAAINADGRGIQIANDDPNRSLIVQDDSNTRLAKDMGLWGSTDIMGSMLLLASSLRDDDQEGTGLLLANLNDSMNHLLNVRAGVGARAIQLENTHSRLVDLDLSLTRLLSEVEDADITTLVTDLATYENNYQASLMAGAKIIQPSLLDFLS